MPTEVDDIDIEDVEEALLRAEELSLITGRKKTDIVADLLDDGKLNLSAGSDTEVKRDILDIAQEKAEKFKTLLTTLIPVLALLLGVGAEGLGVLDVTGWGSDSMWDGESNDSNNIYWGCTNYDAANYDPMATDDDGSCYWDNNNPTCNPSWGYDEYGYVDENNLEVRFTFQDYNNCGIEHYGGHFIITLFESGSEAEQVFLHNIDFTDSISIELVFRDLEGGTYSYRVEFHVVECEDGSCEHGSEYYMPANKQFTIEDLEPQGCDAYLINVQSYLLEEDSEKDAVRISADVDLVDEEDNCDSEQFQITWRLYQDNQVKYEHQTFEDGIVTDPDGADYTFHTWDNVEAGTYDSKVLLMLNGELLDEQWTGHSISIQSPQILGCTDSQATNYNADATDNDGSCEYPPEHCEINIFQIELFTNTTHATVNFDLDCGYEPNELEGYNVSVQFLIYEVNATANDNSLQYETCIHYIQGFVGDIQVIVLDNFSQNNTTHYDIYWYAVWIDGDNQQQFLEQKWLNREMNS